MEKEKSTNFVQADHIETITSESKCYLQISKPDFLGGDKWEFKHESLMVVKILDKEWLNKFRNGEITVKPGDVLEVALNLKKNYSSYSKHLLNFELSITKVISIHNTPQVEYYAYHGNFEIKDWKFMADPKNFKKEKISVPIKTKLPKIEQSTTKLKRRHGKRK